MTPSVDEVTSRTPLVVLQCRIGSFAARFQTEFYGSFRIL